MKDYWHACDGSAECMGAPCAKPVSWLLRASMHWNIILNAWQRIMRMRGGSPRCCADSCRLYQSRCGRDEHFVFRCAQFTALNAGVRRDAQAGRRACERCRRKNMSRSDTSRMCRPMPSSVRRTLSARCPSLVTAFLALTGRRPPPKMPSHRTTLRGMRDARRGFVSTDQPDS